MHKQQCHFALWFVGRTGSSFLRGMIDQHPEGNCQGELLWPHYRKTARGTVEAFLDKKILTRKSAARGFKCPHEHLYKIPEVLSYLRAREYGVLRLVRRNKLDHYLSMRLAQINGKWTSVEGRYDRHRVEVDADHFLQVAAEFQQTDQKLAASAKDFVCHEVAYEDLLDGSGWFPVCDFLGIERRHVESPFQRQRELPQNEAILNYDALKERCRGSFAEPFFMH